jgi:hypothetical protein
MQLKMIADTILPLIFVENFAGSLAVTKKFCNGPASYAIAEEDDFLPQKCMTFSLKHGRTPLKNSYGENYPNFLCAKLLSAEMAIPPGVELDKELCRGYLRRR